jgi:hypothetical protein
MRGMEFSESSSSLTPSLIAFLNSLVYGGLLVLLVGFLLSFLGVVDPTERKSN